MVAHFEIPKSKSLEDLINDLALLRKSGLHEIKTLNIQETDLIKFALHPKLGTINLQQLIATWATHDLTHIAQISRIMAKQNKENVGPFAPFLNILN